MNLDPRTLIFACVLDATVLGTIAFVFARREGATRTIGTWGVAMLMLAIGLAGIALRDEISGLFSVILANAVIVAALVVALDSLRLLRGRATSDPWGWTLVTLVLVLEFVFLDVVPDYRARVVVISVALAIMFARGALVLQPAVPAEVRRSFRFTEYVFWGATLLTAARAIGALYEQAVGLLAPELLRVSTFLFYIAVITATTLGVLWMQIQLLQRDLVRLARVDSLTGVLNRGAFLKEFEREVSRAEREEGVFSLAIFDLDQFKQLNDRYGHPLGDEVLKAFTEVLANTIRKHDVIGRYGGEEFALLMPNTGKNTATGVAERVRLEVESSGVKVDGQRIEFTVSGGVATFSVDGQDWDSLLCAADTALYNAKGAGRNRVLCASPRAGHKAALA